MIFSYFAEYKSKLFLNRCKWFEMLFLLGLYEQLRRNNMPFRNKALPKEIMKKTKLCNKF